MWTSSFVILAFFSVALASESELSVNGWMPVSNDIVYNQIRHGVTKPQRFPKVDIQTRNTDVTSFISQHQEYESAENRDETVTGPVEVNIKESGNTNDTNENKPYLLLKHNLRPRSMQISNIQNLSTKGYVRRSKKLADFDSHILYNSIPPKNDQNYKNFLKHDKILGDKRTEDATHTYEVTENISGEEKIPVESSVKESGYEYNPPTTRNFTNDLIKHLFKYNIKDVDNLQNYALSRRPKIASPMTREHPYKTVQVRIPIRYNSLNHLPVDPLLAVFLSNYGHYLQGQYGVQNNYENLYGYLASNNIHNNRPFGFYKLFSDNDSSNM